ncbi:hypothetical protein EUX98_g2224 [Antrodiella citrinella]|uniref:Uncharacterized protein n=1 Tax=Antrodiella citrinella TaxID=2447956 RepID=A0A4S4MZI1_9APHY|nr:hypothetical protein EUX98_g2224 [Antrodiella citrinella]
MDPYYSMIMQDARWIASSAEVGNSAEQYWRALYDFFASKGYILRPRLRPGWTPSWQANVDVQDKDRANKLFRQEYEDALWEPSYYSMEDSIDPRDHYGDLFMIKRMETDSQEVNLLLEFSTLEMRANPYNHSVPVLDHFLKPDDPSVTFIVTPYLRPIKDPPFRLAGEIMGYLEQVLEVHPPDGSLEDAEHIERNNCNVAYYFGHLRGCDRHDTDLTDTSAAGVPTIGPLQGAMTEGMRYDLNHFINGFRPYWTILNHIKGLEELLDRMKSMDTGTALREFVEFRRMTPQNRTRQWWSLFRIS